jgi:hypothetical protein
MVLHDDGPAWLLCAMRCRAAGAAPRLILGGAR